MYSVVGGYSLNAIPHQDAVNIVRTVQGGAGGAKVAVASRYFGILLGPANV